MAEDTFSHDTNHTKYMSRIEVKCAPGKDSDQPGQLPSLIIVFACVKRVDKGLSSLHSDNNVSDQTGLMPIHLAHMPLC